jgi:hypothetical protein
MTAASARSPGKDVVLVTSAIGSPPAFLKITNHDERLLQTLCCLVRWIRDTSAETIVLCDGTMTPFDFSKVRAFAEKHGKTFETLVFQESDNFLKHGKGYGEGEVLEYAVENSAHLAEGGSFYKVTGRTFVANFDDIRKAHASDEAVFASPAWSLMPADGKTDTHRHLSAPFRNAMKLGPVRAARRAASIARILTHNLLRNGVASLRDDHTVWTQFYKCDVSFFRKHFLKAYTRVDDAANPIEHEYHRRLRGVRYAPMAIRPRIVGRNAGYDLPYDEEYSDEVRATAETLR